MVEREHEACRRKECLRSLHSQIHAQPEGSVGFPEWVLMTSYSLAVRVLSHLLSLDPSSMSYQPHGGVVAWWRGSLHPWVQMLKGAPSRLRVTRSTFLVASP